MWQNDTLSICAALLLPRKRLPSSGLSECLSWSPQFLKTTPGYIVCILVPFLLLILLEGIRCIRLFRKYKAEQQAELQAERDKIEAERAETQRMMQELLQMKAQMAQNEQKPSEKADSDTTPTV